MIAETLSGMFGSALRGIRNATLENPTWSLDDPASYEQYINRAESGQAVSPERLAFASREGINAYIGAIRTPAELAETAGTYRDGLAASGHDPAERTLSVNRFIYVSDDDERARAEFEQPFLELMHERAPDLKGALVAKYGGVEELTFDRFLADFCVCGGPETVTRRLREVIDATHTDYLLATLNFVTLDHQLCLRSMELFGAEVMPALAPSAAPA